VLVGVGPNQAFDFVEQFREKDGLFSLKMVFLDMEIDPIRNFEDGQV
jgi:hypothetical protein